MIIPLVPPKPDSIATSTSTARYQTISNVNMTPSSSRTVSNPKTSTSFDGAQTLSAGGDVISSSSDSDDDKKKKPRSQKKK